MKKLENLIQEQEKKDDIQNLIDEVRKDFAKRQQERRAFEAQWQLNMNFLLGNQFCGVNTFGEIEDNGKDFYWQQNEVFNHIAPIIDVRLAKLNRVRPKMNVTPASGDDADLKTAKTAKKIVNSIYNRLQLSEAVKEATKWSEICGTSFYKIIWNSGKGKVIGIAEKQRTTGEVDISVCSPFEIYPESSSNSGIDDCQSVIHAKALPVQVISDIWNRMPFRKNFCSARKMPLLPLLILLTQ